MMHFILLLLVWIQGTLAQTSLRARVSYGGLKAVATFDQTAKGEAVTVTFSANLAATTWEIHSHRVNYDLANPCAANQLGVSVFTGNEASNKTVTGLELSGLNGIEGKSIAFYNSGDSPKTPVACANVESGGNYVTARALFRQSVLGEVLFRQQNSSSAALTRVIVDLYTDGSRKASALNWILVSVGDCSTIGDPFNPTRAAGTPCSSSDHSGCAVGNLVDRLGPVQMGVTAGSARATFTDLLLPLTGSSIIVETSLLLYVDGQQTPLACAPVTLFEPRTGVARFNNDGVEGSISLSQASPLDAASVRVNLSGLASRAGGYHVHEWPVPQQVSASQALCSAGSVLGHFNPFSVTYDANSPGAGQSTEEKYEVGDLSGKFGVLASRDSLSEVYLDYNLQLFGARSVLSRSLVIHYSNGSRWICANIRSSQESSFALATFTFPLVGHVLMEQPISAYHDAETSVYVSLDYADGSTTETKGHALSVTGNASAGDWFSTDVNARCKSVGGTFNPTRVSSSDYSQQCSPAAPLRCLLGDLSGKHGAVGVRGTRAFFTDVNLPLDGPSSVLQRAVLVKAAEGGSQTLACANLLPVMPLLARTQSWGGAGHGTVSVSQSVGVVQLESYVRLELKGLPADTAAAFAINSRPVAASDQQRCDGLGAAYNPFKVMSPGSSHDQKPVGDLSGKLGTVTSASVDLTLHDPNINLWGPRAVQGRAISLSWGGGPQACADLHPYPANGGKLLTAVAQFTGSVTGHVKLLQVVDANSAFTPTTVLVELRNANGTQTSGHNWHVHEKYVGKDTAGLCTSVKGHYNPFAVNMEASYSECGMANPLRCELGDQSSKLGTYDMGSGTMVFNDVYLPLSGPFTVVGRSITIHAANKGAPRIACADILPDTMTHTRHLQIKTPATLDKDSLIRTYATAIDTEIFNVAVIITSKQKGCTGVRVYFLGLDAEALTQRFQDVVTSQPGKLGDFKQVTCAACMHVTCLTLLPVLLLIGQLLS